MSSFNFDSDSINLLARYSDYVDIDIFLKSIDDMFRDDVAPQLCRSHNMALATPPAEDLHDLWPLNAYAVMSPTPMSPPSVRSSFDSLSVDMLGSSWQASSSSLTRDLQPNLYPAMDSPLHDQNQQHRQPSTAPATPVLATPMLHGSPTMDFANASYFDPIVTTTTTTTTTTAPTPTETTDGRIKPHACHLCSSTFYRRPDLRRHMKTLHQPKSFLCDRCGKCFARADALRSHVARHGNRANGRLDKRWIPLATAASADSPNLENMPIQ